MLHFISIRNFAIIEHWDLELQQGLTVVTGESGAGKSILIDAIELGLGGRGDSNSIRQGAQRAEISLTFDVSNLKKVQKWLVNHDYDIDDNHECILRRVMTTDGRSRVSINGTPCTLQQVKIVATLLMNIHGQHQNQSLMSKTHQLEMLDYFANHPKLTQNVKTIHQQWHQAHTQLQKLQNHSDNFQAQVDLLQYQVTELDEFDLKENEYSELDSEQKTLANAEHYLTSCQQALQELNNDDNTGAINQLHHVLNNLSHMNSDDPHITSAVEMINNAIIQCEETTSELSTFVDHFSADPMRLNEVENRLDSIHTLARKHHVDPVDLFQKHIKLQQELDEFLNASTHITELQQQLRTLQSEFSVHAEKLTKSRIKFAKVLSKQVSEKIALLGMKGGKFDIQWHKVQDNQPHAFGLETAEFMVSANPGQPLQSLSKVASGGEMSRIALAIQVITSQSIITPTLIFDEVDVGIGGQTAATVGSILRELSVATQVICITHQPQVAACGHHHCHVNKTTANKNTLTQIDYLDENLRVEEIARMLGGKNITDSTFANAKSLMEEVSA